MYAIHPTHKKKVQFILVFFGDYLLGIIKQYFAFNYSYGLLDLLFTVAITIYILFFTTTMFENKLYKKLISIGIFSLCILITEVVSIGIITTVFQAELNRVSDFGLLNILTTLLANILLALLCNFVVFCQPNKIIAGLLKRKEIVPIMLVMIAIEIPLIPIFNHSDIMKSNINVFILSCIVQFILFSVALYIAFLIQQQLKRVKEIEEELEQTKKIMDLTVKLRDLKHDMSFHVNMIQNFVYQKEYDALFQYIQTAFTNVAMAEDVFTLSDRSVSLTLNLMAQKARQEKIKFTHMITVSDFLLPSSEICSLLSNIITNAMEACAQLEEEQRYVSLELIQEPTGYFIRCINPYQNKPNFQCGKLTTSKGDYENHGYGLGIIKNITERNNGITKISVHELSFELYCFIPNIKRRQRHEF